MTQADKFSAEEVMWFNFFPAQHSVNKPLEPDKYIFSCKVKQMFQSSNIDAAGNLDYKSLCYIITHGEEQEEWEAHDFSRGSGHTIHAILSLSCE